MGRRFYGCGGVNYYHVTSRIVDKRVIFGTWEKRFFSQQVEVLSRFTGVRVLTHCLMGNHFHLVLEVPANDGLRERVLAGGAEAFATLENRMRALYGGTRARNFVTLLADHLVQDRASAARELLDPIVARMGDLSSFLRDLKWRFTVDYNRRKARTGTLWEGRFRSVVLEGGRRALETVCAYVDLNPVRAGLVSDPAEYPFSGYGKAIAGHQWAREGLRRVAETESRNEGQEMEDWAAVQARYRVLLYGAGEGRGLTSEQVTATVAEGGALSTAALIRHRVRYFTSGAAIGSDVFLEQLFEARRDFFGSRRRHVARSMQGGDWEGLGALRSLSDPVVPPSAATVQAD